jgi:hypothetical protein
MNPKEKAIDFIKKFTLYLGTDINGKEFFVSELDAKRCALIAVNEIIAANPHSNPFNTPIYKTIDYWLKVKIEIEKL